MNSSLHAIAEAHPCCDQVLDLRDPAALGKFKSQGLAAIDAALVELDPHLGAKPRRAQVHIVGSQLWIPYVISAVHPKPRRAQSTFQVHRDPIGIPAVTFFRQSLLFILK